MAQVGPTGSVEHKGNPKRYHGGVPLPDGLRKTAAGRAGCSQGILGGDCTISPQLALATVNYLQDLKEKLEISAEYAREHSVGAQKHYTDTYNRRAKDKSFEVGERVVVLYRDSTNKVESTETRYGTTILSRHSYLVDMGDGSCMLIICANLYPQ